MGSGLLSKGGREGGGGGMGRERERERERKRERERQRERDMANLRLAQRVCYRRYQGEEVATAILALPL